jgi:hypothetical protein
MQPRARQRDGARAVLDEVAAETPAGWLQLLAPLTDHRDRRGLTIRNRVPPACRNENSVSNPGRKPEANALRLLEERERRARIRRARDRRSIDFVVRVMPVLAD